MLALNSSTFTRQYQLETVLDIEARFEIEFLEIGTDDDHAHFFVQSVPTYSPTKIVTIIKSFTAREVFKRAPHVKKQLWGGEFWSDGYFVSTVGPHADETTIKKYVKKQGDPKSYKQLYGKQLRLL